MKLHEMVRRWKFWMLLLAEPCTAIAAECKSDTGKPGTYIMTLPASVTVNPDLAIGATLASYQGAMVLQGVTNTTCPPLPVEKPNSFTLHTQTYLGNSIYASGIPGIGIRLRFTHINGIPFPYNNLWTFPHREEHNWTGSVELVKTGPISQGGLLSGIEASGALPGENNYRWRLYLFTAMRVDPGRPTCKVTTPAVSVSMARAKQSEFTGVGMVSEARDFSIGVSCAEGRPGITTAIHGVLTDQTVPGNRSTTLSLSSDSTAAGVGVQILLNDDVLGYGADSIAADTENRWLAGSSGNGDFTIPLSARYVQTLPEVTAGSANARATFTLSYD